MGREEDIVVSGSETGIDVDLGEVEELESYFGESLEVY